jgi:hypothetical protein
MATGRGGGAGVASCKQGRFGQQRLEEDLLSLSEENVLEMGYAFSSFGVQIEMAFFRICPFEKIKRPSKLDASKNND